jgi:mRNA-degrading endonuclease RelE of RelBE toxin-antitoxin system
MRVYQIEYLPEVLHDVLRLGVRDQQAIKAKIECLSVYSDEIPHQRLEGKRLKHKFKPRVGDYRVIYSLDRKRGVIVIELVGHRSTIYREK